MTLACGVESVGKGREAGELKGEREDIGGCGITMGKVSLAGDRSRSLRLRCCDKTEVNPADACMRKIVNEGLGDLWLMRWAEEAERRGGE